MVSPIDSGFPLSSSFLGGSIKISVLMGFFPPLFILQDAYDAKSMQFSEHLNQAPACYLSVLSRVKVKAMIAHKPTKTYYIQLIINCSI